MNTTTSTMAVPERPVPEPSIDSLPYWEGLKEGRLLLQQCTSCGRFRHYPTPTCPHCHSFEHQWTESSGKATVHSWTVAHHPFHPAFRALLPYAVVTADLPEGVRMVAMTKGIEPHELKVGLPLAISFERIPDGFVVPVFVPR